MYVFLYIYIYIYYELSQEFKVEYVSLNCYQIVKIVEVLR